MVTGTVDVRTRDDSSRHGKWRIDELAKHLHTLNPQPSDTHVNFYKNMWDPSKFKKS